MLQHWKKSLAVTQIKLLSDQTTLHFWVRLFWRKSGHPLRAPAPDHIFSSAVSCNFCFFGCSDSALAAVEFQDTTLKLYEIPRVAQFSIGSLLLVVIPFPPPYPRTHSAKWAGLVQGSLHLSCSESLLLCLESHAYLCLGVLEVKT